MAVEDGGEAAPIEFYVGNTTPRANPEIIKGVFELLGFFHFHKIALCGENTRRKWPILICRADIKIANLQ